MNYGARANRAEERIFADPEISETNKQLLQRFLMSYDVSVARKVIFLQKIRPVLKRFSDISSALQDRDGINGLFASLRTRYSPATYATYIIVTKRFLRWLNNGERAPGACDLKVKRGRMMQRELRPEDMLTWSDGQKVASASLSAQMTAIVLTQLDGGFRPSEFVDLNFGDVEIRTGLAAFHVRGGKTGARTVITQRCVPTLLKWMEIHPTKRPEDPLWISEDSVSSNGKNLEVKRYAYPAMSKRLRETGQRAGLRKPLDFYNLRHSSCVLDKLDNLPTDLAAERHGHSVKHFVGTYGRLSVQDVMRRFQSHYGMQAEGAGSTPQAAHQICPSCRTLNEQDSQWCSRCGTPFTTQEAIFQGKRLRIGESSDPAAQKEVEMLRLELEHARKRESTFLQQQAMLLEQMQSIRSSLGQERILWSELTERLPSRPSDLGKGI